METGLHGASTGPDRQFVNGWKSQREKGMDLFDLSGKTAIITGSSRGIGRALAEAFAEAGATVVISSRTQQACEEVAAALNARCGADRTSPRPKYSHYCATRMPSSACTKK